MAVAAARRFDPEPRAADGGPDPQAAAWRLLLAARRAIDAGAVPPKVPPALAARDRAAAGLLDIFLDLALTPHTRGWTLAVLGQSLDGYVATDAGESQGLNAGPGLDHLHRVRALSDAVLVGASTAVLDRPRLTTRRVEGPSPVRVVVDPRGRLPAGCPLLRDGAAPTLVLRAAAGAGGAAAGGEEREERLAEHVRVLTLPADGPEIPPARILAVLRARGLGRVLVEGGGDTVSRFLRAGLLDRVHLLVAPVLLGAGRRGLVPPPAAGPLATAWRPPCRRHLLGGGDVLFAFRLDGDGRPVPPGPPAATATAPGCRGGDDPCRAAAAAAAP